MKLLTIQEQNYETNMVYRVTNGASSLDVGK